MRNGDGDVPVTMGEMLSFDEVADEALHPLASPMTGELGRSASEDRPRRHRNPGSDDFVFESGSLTDRLKQTAGRYRTQSCPVPNNFNHPCPNYNYAEGRWEGGHPVDLTGFDHDTCMPDVATPFPYLDGALDDFTNVERRHDDDLKKFIHGGRGENNLADQNLARWFRDDGGVHHLDDLTPTFLPWFTRQRQRTTTVSSSSSSSESSTASSSSPSSSTKEPPPDDDDGRR